MNWRVFLRRQGESEAAQTADLIAEAEERLAFLERDYGYDRQDDLAGVDSAERHPDVSRADDIVLAFRNGQDVVKLSRAVVPNEGEAIFLEWFPFAIPQASYLYTGIIEGEGTRQAYDRELARMADDLREGLEIAARHWKERGGD
jgi:hypothetical protein